MFLVSSKENEMQREDLGRILVACSVLSCCHSPDFRRHVESALIEYFKIFHVS